MDNTPNAPNKTEGNSSDNDFESIRSQMGETSEDDADRRARVEYLRSLTGNKRPKKRWKWLIIIIGIVILLALVAAGAYWLLVRSDESKKSNEGVGITESSKNGSESEPQTEVAKIIHYDSTTFNLGIDHPENWNVSDKGDGRLLVVSPVTKLKVANGTSRGQIYFMIQAKQSTLPGFAKGNAIAVRDSEKIAYTKPTSMQRAQTYMTFVSYAGAATTGIDAIFVTGDLGYKKDQAVPQADIIGGDPLVSFGFTKCSNDDVCPADPASAKVTVADSWWNENDDQSVKAAKNILLSLSIN